MFDLSFDEFFCLRSDASFSNSLRVKLLELDMSSKYFKFIWQDMLGCSMFLAEMKDFSACY